MIETLPRIDNEKFIAHSFYIDNKRGEIVPFRFNRVQSYIHRNKTNRNIILKARQMGVTSSILADMLADDLFIPHMHCAVVSHETRSTQRLLDRVRFYYDTMKPPKPRLGTESRTELSFPELHSSIYIGTAGSRAFGRGDTIRKALLSELAFYEDAEKILSGIEDAIPITGELTIESTANGEDNVFYDRWVQARSGSSPYKPFFFPWWWDDEYSIPLNSPLALPEDRGELELTDEEQELVDREGLNENQIRWRRWKIAEKGNLFFIEYPENEVDCFLSTGSPVFDPGILSNLANNCYEGTGHTQGFTFWLEPVKDRRYFIGADSSAGVPNGSFSAAVVLSEFNEVVATYQGRIDPKVYSTILKEMGAYYNNALIAVERNFTGYAVLSNMMDYPNLYYQKDLITGRVTNQVGWWTNEPTKDLMTSRLKDILPVLKLWDINLVRQLRGYRYIHSKATAQSFDDMVIALMIATVTKTVTGTSRGYMGSSNNWGW